MRLSEFWARMQAAFGAAYADTLARDHVLADLGGRTVHEALAAGESAKEIWSAVCAEFPIPTAAH